MEEEIINMYVNDNISLEKLCSIFKIGKIKLREILLKNNIKIKSRGGQIKNEHIKKTAIDIGNKVLICKRCGKIYNDTENKSGGIISHISKCNNDVEIPSSYIRRKYKKIHGVSWHIQYFDIVEKENNEKLKCPLCNWKTCDLTNKSGSFTKHIEKKHNGIESFINNFPSYKNYFITFNNDDKRNKDLLNDFVTCKICGKKFKSINNRHLMNVHNMTLYDYKIKFLGFKCVSDSTIQKLKDNYEENLRYFENDYKSNPEEEISNIIRKCGFKVLNNNKSILNGIELDIFVEDLKLAIEYNGLFYHNENSGKNKWYHLNKQKLAKEKNINLIHIFEDEWIHNKDICINKIKHIIHKNNSEKIYARNCIIKEVNKEIADIFLNKNHIQGAVLQSTYNLGAFYNNKVVSIMSFLRQNDNTFILNRFATDINYIVTGVGSKLFKKFVNDHKNVKIISFADRRWTTDENNNFYTKMGFKLTKILNPDYRYFNPKISRNKRIHKFLLRKSKLLKLYPDVLNNEMCENEMTKITGYYKIWDCGLFKYEYK